MIDTELGIPQRQISAMITFVCTHSSFKWSGGGWGGGAQPEWVLWFASVDFSVGLQPQTCPFYAALGNRGRVLRMLFLDVQAGRLWVQASKEGILAGLT